MSRDVVYLLLTPILEFSPDWELHEHELECLILQGVTFKQDFGVFKKGDTPSTLTFDFAQGTVCEYDDETGDELRKAAFSIIPRE